MVGFVVVSHSEKVAQGIVDICKQFNDTSLIVDAGGIEDRIGTDVIKIKTKIEEINEKSDKILVFGDLGSSILSADMAIEMLDDEIRPKIHLVDAPLIEGMIAASISAIISDDIEYIIHSAKETRTINKF